MLASFFSWTVTDQCDWEPLALLEKHELGLGGGSLMELTMSARQRKALFYRRFQLSIGRERAIFRGYRLKFPPPIKTKFGTNKYRSKVITCTNIYCNRCRSFVSLIYWNCSFFHIKSTIRFQPKRTGRFSYLIYINRSCMTAPKMYLLGYRWKFS